MTLTPAIFGIDSGLLNTVVQLVALAVLVVWLALAWYTLADAKRRLDDQMLVGSAVLASLIFPFLGTVVYMIVRPPEYLDDVRERELEMEAAKARLASLEYQLCPHCDAAAGRDFLRCPHCLRKLRDTCAGCSKPLDPDWMICPYCEAEIPGVTPQRGRRRRSASEDVSPDVAPEYGEVSQAPPGYGDEVSHAPPGYGEQAGETYAELSEAHGEDTLVARAPGEGAFDDVAWSDSADQGPGAAPPQH